jgi:tetratricopeptide (TPR) repeat protein
MGSVDAAKSEAERAARLAAADDFDAQSRWRGLTAGVLVESGRGEEAIPFAREAVELARDAEYPLVTALALADLAAALGAAGRHDEAAAVRDEALSIYERKGDRASARQLQERVAPT